MGKTPDWDGRKEPLTAEERQQIIDKLSSSMKTEKIRANSVIPEDARVDWLVDLVDRALQTAYNVKMPDGWPWEADPIYLADYNGKMSRIVTTSQALIEAQRNFQNAIEQARLCKLEGTVDYPNIGVNQIAVAIRQGVICNDAEDCDPAEIFQEAVSILSRLDILGKQKGNPGKMLDQVKNLTRAICHWREMHDLKASYHWKDFSKLDGDNPTTKLIVMVAKQFGVQIVPSQVNTHLRNYGSEIRKRPDHLGRTEQDDFSDGWT